MASAIMMGIAVMGMVGSVGSSGYEAGVNADKVRDQIKSIKQRTADLREKFNTIMKDAAKYTAEMKSEMIQNIDAIVSSHASLKLAQENFLESKKKVQMAGLFFVVIIFFLLLMKYTGITDMIVNFALSPFQKK